MSNVNKFKCPKCNKSFPIKLSLNQHIEVKHKSFKCIHCNRDFETQNALAQHLLNSKCKNKKLVKQVDCSYCNRKFKSTDALKQHINSKHFKEFICPQCNKGFQKQNSLNQHIKAKHAKSQAIRKENSNRKLSLGVYDGITFAEKVKIFIRNLIKTKKTILMDECVGNDDTVKIVLEKRYFVMKMPNQLLSHKDNDLRLVLKEKNWGLVSKDFEMVIKARRVIKPVYFLKEVRGNRALIKISKRNSEMNKSDKVNLPIINSAKI